MARPLDYENLNENVKKCQYAVRGELYLRASELQKEGKKVLQVMLVLFLETEGWCVSFSGYAHACIAMCVSYVWFSSDDVIGNTSFFHVFFLLLHQNWFCSPN